LTIHNITELRKSKQYVKDLEKALKLLNMAEAGLRNYEKYRAINTILTTIAYEKPFIEIALEQHKIIVQTKGERRR